MKKNKIIFTIYILKWKHKKLRSKFNLLYKFSKIITTKKNSRKCKRYLFHFYLFYVIIICLFNKFIYIY